MYRVLAWMARVLVGTFYRVERIGRPLADEGPVVLVGNHSNGLVDPALFVCASPRPVRFLAKFTLFEMPVLGTIVRSLGAIPIYRRKDGVGTERNELSFAAASEALAAGGVLGLFPEGTSHSGHRLLPLKTGAARIALGAEARAGFDLGVRIQPVGLDYEDRGRFRSRVTLWVGEPFGVSDLAEAHARDPWPAVLELTGRIERALRPVVVEYADAADRARLDVVATARQGSEWRGPVARRALVAWLADLRRTDPAGAGELIELLDRIRAHGAPRRFGWRLAALAPAAVLLGPPALLALVVPRWTPLDADKDATVTLITAWVAFPAWAALGVGLAAAYAGPLPAGLVLLAMLASGLLAVRAWPDPRIPFDRRPVPESEREDLAGRLPRARSPVGLGTAEVVSRS